MIAFVLAGASSNVGKTTISTLLMHGFVQRGLTVQAFKAGPDYLDPTFHSFVTKRPSINLDYHMMGEEGIKEAFYSHLENVDVAIVEGVMGLYDGADMSLDNGSAAHIARLLGIPVLLIVDGSGISTTIGAMVLGYKNFDTELNLGGVIINKVGSAMHYQLLSSPIEHYTQINTYGYLPKMKETTLKSRHLGLYPAKEIENLQQMIADMYSQAEETIDYDKIASDFVMSDRPLAVPDKKQSEFKVRLAIAKDEAFYFYYAENLEMFANKGVELVEFSPIHDDALPNNIDGVYIGGGYPELHLEALAANKSMKASILAASKDGLPIYAECGGLMYLTKSIVDLENNQYEMVGVFDTKSEMTTRLQHFGYVNVTTNQDSILGPLGTSLKGDLAILAIASFSSPKSLINITKASNLVGAL